MNCRQKAQRLQGQGTRSAVSTLTWHVTSPSGARGIFQLLLAEAAADTLM